MNTNRIAIALVILMLLVAISALTGFTAMADQPQNLPHDGGCVAWCALSYPMSPTGEFYDGNGNGHQENCLVEGMCHLATRNPNIPPGSPQCGSPEQGEHGCAMMPSCQAIHGMSEHPAP